MKPNVEYFKRKLALVIRDIDLYTSEELSRELARLARTSDPFVLLETEFQSVRGK